MLQLEKNKVSLFGARTCFAALNTLYLHNAVDCVDVCWTVSPDILLPSSTRIECAQPALFLCQELASARLARGDSTPTDVTSLTFHINGN